MRQYILVILQEIGKVCWLLTKKIFLLVVSMVNYIYMHRLQIMRHKVTLPVLILLSVIWTGFSSFRYVKKDKKNVLEQATLSEVNTDSSAVVDLYVDPAASEEHYQDDSNQEEPFQDTRLVTHIMDWVGTPHRDNTQSKNGTDCSGFVQAVFQDAHGIDLSRSSRAMYDNDVQKIDKKKLREGDLVFFNTFGHDISHVGIYLKDGKFAHTSTSKGVTVSSLNERYYRRNYRGAGRVKLLRQQ